MQEASMPERQESNRFQASSAATQSATPTSPGRLLERGRQVGQDAKSFAANLEGLVSDAEQFVRTRLEAQPYGTLAIAAGAGFVVGGGVTLGVLATMARLGTRMAAAAMLQSTFARVFSGSESATSDGRGASHENA
jgi:ElaB/YqjD/DUF883 family membrane-anchored ribosome-binding protein